MTHSQAPRAVSARRMVASRLGRVSIRLPDGSNTCGGALPRQLLLHRPPKLQRRGDAMERVVGSAGSDHSNRAEVENSPGNPLVDGDALNFAEHNLHRGPADEPYLHDDALVRDCEFGRLVTNEGAEQTSHACEQEDDANDRDITVEREDGEPEEEKQGR